MVNIFNLKNIINNAKIEEEEKSNVYLDNCINEVIEIIDIIDPIIEYSIENNQYEASSKEVKIINESLDEVYDRISVRIKRAQRFSNLSGYKLYHNDDLDWSHAPFKYKKQKYEICDISNKEYSEHHIESQYLLLHVKKDKRKIETIYIRLKKDKESMIGLFLK